MRAAWTPERKAAHAMRQRQWTPKDETRQKMRESAAKRVRTPEEIAKYIAVLRKVDRNSPEFRAKLSAGCKARWALDRTPRYKGKSA